MSAALRDPIASGAPKMLQNVTPSRRISAILRGLALAVPSANDQGCVRSDVNEASRLIAKALSRLPRSHGVQWREGTRS